MNLLGAEVVVVTCNSLSVSLDVRSREVDALASDEVDALTLESLALGCAADEQENVLAFEVDAFSFLMRLTPEVDATA